MHRFAKLALALPLIFGSAGVLIAQDPANTEAPKQDAPKTEGAKKDAPKQDESKKEAAKPEDAKKEAAKQDEPKPDAPKAAAVPAKPAAPVLKPIPPEVQAKLDAARKAVAEAIAACEAAGLVETSVEPPPILDILFTGQANDVAALKAVTKDEPEAGVSPEVFGGWFTGYGKLEGIKPELNVRIMPPSKGLTELYRARSTIMAPLLAEARKNAKPPAKPVEEPKKEAEKPAAKPDETKKDAEKPKEEPKKEAEKPAEAPKEEKNAEAPKEEPKKEAEKPAETPAEAPKTETPKSK